MFEGLLGQLVSGALWGAGTGLVMTALRGGTGVRPVARAFMHAYVVASDKVREVTAEARESVEDMYAEAQADRRNTATAAEASPIIAPGQTSARRREARSSGTNSAAARSRARGRTTRGSRTGGAGEIVTPAEAAAEAPAGASAAE